jgi:hypothetical protein
MEPLANKRALTKSSNEKKIISLPRGLREKNLKSLENRIKSTNFLRKIHLNCIALQKIIMDPKGREDFDLERLKNIIPVHRRIESPTDKDVLFGRGNGSTIHNHSSSFRTLITANKKQYQKEGQLNSIKREITNSIVKAVKIDGGRFLKPFKNKEGAILFWYEASDKKAFLKTMDALRVKEKQFVVDDITKEDYDNITSQESLEKVIEMCSKLDNTSLDYLINTGLPLMKRQRQAHTSDFGDLIPSPSYDGRPTEQRHSVNESYSHSPSSKRFLKGTSTVDGIDWTETFSHESMINGDCQGDSILKKKAAISPLVERMTTLWHTIFHMKKDLHAEEIKFRQMIQNLTNHEDW